MINTVKAGLMCLFLGCMLMFFSGCMGIGMTRKGVVPEVRTHISENRSALSENETATLHVTNHPDDLPRADDLPLEDGNDGAEDTGDVAVASKAIMPAPPNENKATLQNLWQSSKPYQSANNQDLKDNTGAPGGVFTVERSNAGRPDPVLAGRSTDFPQTVTLNFDNANLEDVIRVIGDMLGLNYVVDPKVKGVVNIHTTGELTQDDLHEVLNQILQMNGLATVTLQSGLVKIVSARDVPQMPYHSNPRDGMILQVIPLQYVSVNEVSKLIKPFVSGNGLIVSDAKTDLLLIMDNAENMPKIVALTRLFDADVFGRLSHKFYTLKYADAEEIASLIANILGIKSGSDAYRFVPIQRLNTLIVISNGKRSFEKIDLLIQQLDTANDQSSPQIYVYYVKNGEASDLAQLLGSVFTESKSSSGSAMKKVPAEQKSKEAGGTGRPKTLFPENASQVSEQQNSALTGVSLSGSLTGDINITPDTIRNALIVKALPADYRTISQILEKIDILPRQVLIEVVIAEIRLDDSNKLGIEWAFDSEGNSTDGTFSGSLSGDAGLTFKLGISDKIDASLSAFAENQNVNIISTPRILASDNKEAKINVSTQIPVATSSYNYNGDNDGVLETSIEYKDTGVILSVTPRINDRGLVSMEISQEVSDSAGGVTVGGELYPSFNERKIETSLTVKNGQTIVIGGLMRESEEKTKSGLPGLATLPVVGFLFGKDDRSTEKSELILLITPRVMSNLGEVDAVTHEFKERIRVLSESQKPHQY